VEGDDGAKGQVVRSGEKEKAEKGKKAKKLRSCADGPGGWNRSGWGLAGGGHVKVGKKKGGVNRTSKAGQRGRRVLSVGGGRGRASNLRRNEVNLASETGIQTAGGTITKTLLGAAQEKKFTDGEQELLGTL